MAKICLLLNIAPIYRRSIFMKMDSFLGCDFIFGDSSVEGIALMNPASLHGFRCLVHNVYQAEKLVWQKGAFRQAFAKNYDTYILTGNPGIRSNWFIALVARLLGRKVILWSHGLRGGESRLSRYKNMAYFALASHILLYGERASNILIDRGIKPQKLTVIYNSLDWEKQLELRAKLGDGSFARNYFGSDDPYVCFVGRLTGGKRLDILLHAMSLVKGYNLILVGIGPEQEPLEELCRSLGLEDRVWFYGECYDEQMLGTVFGNAALCVSPGNVGLTAIHSLSMGTPVVTHNNFNEQMPEAEAITDGEN
ncbi:MAG: glycosyltransferase, partial [Mucinivorans sp.]